MTTTESPKQYKTFVRSVKNWHDFAHKRRVTRDTGLSWMEARRRCETFNKNRTPRQIKKGTMMEFIAM